MRPAINLGLAAAVVVGANVAALAGAWYNRGGETGRIVVDQQSSRLETPRSGNESAVVLHLNLNFPHRFTARNTVHRPCEAVLRPGAGGRVDVVRGDGLTAEPGALRLRASCRGEDLTGVEPMRILVPAEMARDLRRGPVRYRATIVAGRSLDLWLERVEVLTEP